MSTLTNEMNALFARGLSHFDVPSDEVGAVKVRGA